MTQGEVWPVEFSFHSAEEETSEEIDASNCILCGFDHSSSECPNYLPLCTYCGEVGRHRKRCERPLLGLPKACYFCDISHPEVSECTIKWQG